MTKKIFKNLFLNFLIIFLTFTGLYLYLQSISKKTDIKDEGFGNSTATKSNKFVCNATNYECVKNLILDLNLPNKNVLLLGNSQLGAINQFSKGEINFAHHLSLNINQKKDSKITLRSIWIPNATFGEFNEIYSSLRNCGTRIDKLVLPLFLDDTREQKIRKSIENYSSKICKNDENSHPTRNEMNTNQVITSNSDKLDQWILKRTFILKDISRLNNHFRVFLYTTRNTIFRINASSKRKIVPAAYQFNLESLERILESREYIGMPTIIYIAPLLHFASGKEIPYLKEEYLNFKKEMKNICSKQYCDFFDLDSIIPDEKWGYKKSSFFNKSKKEIDFMHFTYEGHKILSNKLGIILNNNSEK